MPKANAKKKSAPQRDRFIEAARELRCDDDKDAFEAKLKRIAKPKVKPKTKGMR